MTQGLEMLFCPDCEHDVFAETPPCPDGHDAGACPDRACTECGTALLLDAPLFAMAIRRDLVRGHTAGKGSHAA